MNKISSIAALLILSFFFACTNTNDNQNYFSSDLDTLVIKSEKLPGEGLFATGAGSLHLMDSSECLQYDWWEFPDKVPAGITNIKYSVFSVNFFPIRYYSPDGDTLQQISAKRGFC